MFSSFKKLTGFKLPKTNEAVLKTLSSQGGFRLTLAAGEKIGAEDGDYVTIVQDREDETLLGIMKVGEDDGGAKLATSNKSGVGTLSFSSIPAWLNLGGNEKTYKVYEIGDAVSVPVNEDGSETVNVFPLTLIREEDKPVRQSKGSADASADDEDDV